MDLQGKRIVITGAGGGIGEGLALEFKRRGAAAIIIGDINGDDILNILDIVTLVTIVISGGDNPAADINEDGILNILDIVVLVNLVLNT